MDIRFLIPSKTRQQVLAYFVHNPEVRYCGREMARALKASPQLVYRELINLESWGFLSSNKQGNQRVFSLNQRFPLYPPIRDLFLIYTQEQTRSYNISKVYRLDSVLKRVKKIVIPPELEVALMSPRKRPRAFTETKFLEKGRQ